MTTNNFKDGKEPTKKPVTISDIIGRDAKEVTKRNVWMPKIATNEHRTKNLPFMYSIVRMGIRGFA